MQENCVFPGCVELAYLRTMVQCCLRDVDAIDLEKQVSTVRADLRSRLRLLERELLQRDQQEKRVDAEARGRVVDFKNI